MGEQRYLSLTPTFRGPIPTTNYLHVPHYLLTELQDTPLAVGIWTLIARLHFLTKMPVPLSATDIQTYDPTLKRGAILRAIERLERCQMLCTIATVGQKSSYTPTWGRTGDRVHHWQLDAPQLGRPRHVRAIRIDRTLLDTFIGQIRVHPRHSATVRRRVTVPLLSLIDVGAYALCALGYHHGTPALHRWGLVQHGQPQIVPSEVVVLAQASQHMLIDSEDMLTDSGWGRLGLFPVPKKIPVEQTLFFVPPALIGESADLLIGEMIDCHAVTKIAAPASGRSEEASLDMPPHTTGSQGSQGKKRESSTPASGGGSHDIKIYTINAHQSQTRMPPTPQHASSMHENMEAIIHAPPGIPGAHEPTERVSTQVQAEETHVGQRLRALHIRPDVIESLADISLATVDATIHAAQQRTDVRNVAGWVVAALRASRDSRWQINGADTASTTDWGAVRSWAFAEGLLDLSAGSSTPPHAMPVSSPEQLPVRDAPSVFQEDMPASAPPVDEHKMDRSTPIIVADEQRVMLHECMRIADEDRSVMPPDSDMYARQQSTTTAVPCPSWIDEARWATVPLTMQGVFRDSHLENGAVHARSLQTQRLIDTRYRGWTQELVGSSLASEESEFGNKLQGWSDEVRKQPR